MASEVEQLESGLPQDGHRATDGPSGPVVLGEGDFKYEVSGKNWGQLPDDWNYKEATSVAVDANDRIYVFNRGTSPMIVFDADGNLVDHWGEGEFSNPHGVTVAPDGNIFTVDNGDGTVKKFTPDGKLLMTLGEANKPSPPMSGAPFSVPTHVGVDKKTGEFYVSDGYSNARVHKYSPEGKHLFSWGESGTGEGQFNIVHNVETDSNGWVYIADRENHRIQVFSSEGKFETQWVNLSRAACLYIDTRGDRDLVYIGEYFAGISSNDTGADLGPRVTVMTIDGKVLSKVGTEPYGSQTGRFFSPHGITVDSKGDIYVAEVSHSDYGSGWDIPAELRSMQKLVKV